MYTLICGHHLILIVVFFNQKLAIKFHEHNTELKMQKTSWDRSTLLDKSGTI